MEGNGCNLLVTKHVLASRKRWGPAFRTERCLMPSLQPGDLESSGKKRCPLVFPPWKPTLRINDQDNLMWYIFLAPDSPDLDFSLFLIYEFNSSPNFAFRVEEASLKKNTFVKWLDAILISETFNKPSQKKSHKKTIKQRWFAMSPWRPGSKLAMGPRRPWRPKQFWLLQTMMVWKRSFTTSVELVILTWMAKVLRNSVKIAVSWIKSWTPQLLIWFLRTIE